VDILLNFMQIVCKFLFMEDFLRFLQEHYPGLIALIELVLSFLSAVLLTLLTLKFRGGKDIDGDGKPDALAKFNDWYIEHNGERIYFRDMVFKEDKK